MATVGGIPRISTRVSDRHLEKIHMRAYFLLLLLGSYLLLSSFRTREQVWIHSLTCYGQNSIKPKVRESACESACPIANMIFPKGTINYRRPHEKHVRRCSQG